jgi:hypothetical protein
MPKATTAFRTPKSDGRLDGAVVGFHKVIVLDLAAAEVSDGRAVKVRFSPSYNQSSTTPLVKEVKSGSQTIDLDLDTK